LANRWASLDRRTRYGVESYAWDNAQVGFNRSGRQAALINQRATNPTTGMRAWVVGAPRTDRTGRVVSALVRVNATASRPRPLQSLTTEERYWSEEEGAGGVFRDRAHGVSNHVLGTRTGVRNERELAWRAAFNEVHGDPRSKLNPPTDPATAFRSLAAAEDAVGGLYAAFQRGWNPANRDKIAASEQVTESAAVDGRRTVGFQVVAVGADRPAYLARALARRYGGAPWTGTRPLFPGDERSPEAQEWTRRGNAFTGPPLTTRVTMSGKKVTAYFKSVNRGASAAMGWYIKTFFPDGRCTTRPWSGVGPPRTDPAARPHPQHRGVARARGSDRRRARRGGARVGRAARRGARSVAGRRARSGVRGDGLGASDRLVRGPRGRPRAPAALGAGDPSERARDGLAARAPAGEPPLRGGGGAGV
jgi:hypothetical protein